MASRYPNLHPSASLLDLQNGSSAWDDAPRPSSSSSASTASTSRSATPTLSSWSPPSSNPWAIMATAKKATPPSSPDSQTPQYPSRSTTPTPVAPQPMRPVTMNVTMSPPSHSVAAALDYPPSAPTPSHYRQSSSQQVSAKARLHAVAQQLERIVITPDIAKKFHHNYPQLLVTAEGSKDGKTNAYHWAIKNPLLAILFVLCEDIDALPKACFYDLSDTHLPLTEDDLLGIAASPARVVEQQWRVMIKELPKDGQHVNFTPREVPPLQRLNLLAKSPDQKRVVETVSWLGDSEGRVYVRKTFVCNRSAQQAAAVSQMLAYKKWNHANIARLICSYTLPSAEGVLAAFVTPMAQYNLNEYLKRVADGPLDPSRIRMHFTWINDLIQAVAYVHRQSDKPAHRSIRPDKILVDGSRVFFSPFGIDPDVDGGEDGPGVTSPPQTPTFSFSSSYDPSYIFAAPETLRKHNLTRAGERLADVFSLGCVFLCIFTAGIRGWTLSDFSAYRAASSLDTSFHANIGRVLSWHQRLYPANTNNTSLLPSSHRKPDTFGEIQLLNFIKYMIAENPSQRQKIRTLAPAFQRWHDERRLVKRRSFDDLDVASSGGGRSGSNGGSGGPADRTSLPGRMINMQLGVGHGQGNVPCSFDLDIPTAPTPPPSNYYPPFWQRSNLG